MGFFRAVSLGLGGFVLFVLTSAPAHASSIIYSNLAVTNQIATASRTSSPGQQEIESADDFILTAPTVIDSATFIGLVPLGLSIGSAVNNLNLEIYRVFPLDSGPFDSKVPSRTNSPSDVEFDGRELGSGIASFTTTLLSPSFTALNSVVNGINGSTPATLGEGPVTGQEVLFNVVFSSPIFLPADHYFFVPQVGLSSGTFMWLSASRAPIVPPGTQINPDLQEWIRNQALDPDWLRVGTDIIDGGTPPTFNTAFQLEGNVVPEPGTLILFGTGLATWAARVRRRVNSRTAPRS
jgi:hypothetical protein